MDIVVKFIVFCAARIAALAALAQGLGMFFGVADDIFAKTAAHPFHTAGGLVVFLLYTYILWDMPRVKSKQEADKKRQDLGL